jgi:DNA processing protein
MESLARQDIAIVFDDDQRYPGDLHNCLGRSAPPLVFMAGNHNAVRQPRLAVVGSRNPSRTGKRAARSFASKHAKAGTCIVSGGARGIDLMAHRAAMSTGTTAVVPATGLLRFRWRQAQTQLPNNASWCILGLFPPDSGWHDRNALIRNRAIVALSRAVFAIEPRDKGGTWHSCNTALELGKPLFITSARRNGPYQRSITSLTKRGAIWIEPDAIPEPEELFKIVEKSRKRRDPQKGLFDNEKCPGA